MSNLSTEITNLKQKYREIFLKSSEELNRRMQEIEPENLSKFLDEDVLKDIYVKWVKILEYRNEFQCNGCASCCKLACSEFSPDELSQKAKNGDNFASQFTSTFVPYESEEAAREIYPEYFELLRTKIEDEKVYFYYCPKVTADNRCPDYENRPQICRDFPDNPIGFLPKKCGFAKWKEEVETTALMLRAMLEIVDFYKSKMSEA